MPCIDMCGAAFSFWQSNVYLEYIADWLKGRASTMADNEVAENFYQGWNSGVGGFLIPPWIQESELSLRINVTIYKEQTKHILQLRATGRLLWITTRKWWVVLHAVVENVRNIRREQGLIRRLAAATGIDSDSEPEYDAAICSGEVTSGGATSSGADHTGATSSGADHTFTADELERLRILQRFISWWLLERERLHGHGDGGHSGEDEPDTAE